MDVLVSRCHVFKHYNYFAALKTKMSGGGDLHLCHSDSLPFPSALVPSAAVDDAFLGSAGIQSLGPHGQAH